MKQHLHHPTMLYAAISFSHFVRPTHDKKVNNANCLHRPLSERRCSKHIYMGYREYSHFLTVLIVLKTDLYSFPTILWHIYQLTTASIWCLTPIPHCHCPQLPCLLVTNWGQQIIFLWLSWQREVHGISHFYSSNQEVRNHMTKQNKRSGKWQNEHALLGELNSWFTHVVYKEEANTL